jgi:hypothetical protein
VYASFEFAGPARPTPQRIRTPLYGAHGQILFNQKCAQMKEKGVLIDPADHDIQPIMVQNSWIVKKSQATNTQWDRCVADDIRVVVGFDTL